MKPRPPLCEDDEEDSFEDEDIDGGFFEAEDYEPDEDDDEDPDERSDGEDD
jgi:hypothetical protein